MTRFNIYMQFVRLVFQHAHKNRFLINFHAKFYRFGQSGATVLGIHQLSTHVEVLQAAVSYLPRAKMSDSDKETEVEETMLNPENSKTKPATEEVANVVEPTDETASGTSKDTFSMEKIRQFFSEKLHLYTTDDADEGQQRTVLETVDVNGVIKHWKTKGFKKIVTMVGAGVSTSAGIPDFRSPSTGLYSNLAKYNLPYPEAIFDLEYFHQNPKPFFQLAKELYPGTFKPTPAHYFIKLLHDKGLLVRHYTQNIDTLDRLVGLPEEKIVEAHGTFFTNHCTGCGKEYSMEWAKEEIFADNVPSCPECQATVKPDIVFFGENLPDRFYQLPNQDFKECDLLIIMGTSLTVHPFAGLVDYVNDDCVRLLVNRDKVGSSMGFFRSLVFGEGLCFDLPGNRRDVCFQKGCDDACQYLAEQLGFGDELSELIKKEHARIDAEKLKSENKSDKKSEEVPKAEDKPDKEEDAVKKEETVKKEDA